MFYCLEPAIEELTKEDEDFHAPEPTNIDNEASNEPIETLNDYINMIFNNPLFNTDLDLLGDDDSGMDNGIYLSVCLSVCYIFFCHSACYSFYSYIYLFSKLAVCLSICLSLFSYLSVI